MVKPIHIATILAVAGSALAQLPAGISLPSSLFGLSFSPQCQGAVINVLTKSALAQCFPTADLLPLFTSNGSIVPVLDNFMTDLCYNYPTCSPATLQAAAATVVAGCSADLKKDGFSDDVIVTAFSAYPVLRQVLCLKTTDPYTSKSYGGFLGPPAIPIVGNPIYNSTNGTFCLTSVATQLSAYFQTNLTVPFLGGLISGQNTTALKLATSINPNIVCNQCFFGALEIVNLAAPTFGQLPIAAITGFFGVPLPSYGTTTLNQLFDYTCAYKPLALSTNGQLPDAISVSIVNSSFPVPFTNGKISGSNANAACNYKRSPFGRRVAE